ncbi:MAG TPA: cell wall-binding repeat-containing protein, partial [Coriobacteriia bacterium]|nr:cell wall-binding repeat-containing protein [Coriobacteriia bacterium]
MKRAFVCVLALALMALGPIGGAGALTTADYPSFTVVPVATDGMILSAQTEPEIDGRRIVYEQGVLFIGQDENVGVYDIATGSRTFIDDGDLDETNPDIAADRVAFESSTGNGQIWVNDLRTGSFFRVDSGTDASEKPRISGSHVVWHNITRDVLQYHDFATGMTSDVPESADATHWDTDRGMLLFSVDENDADPEPDADTLWLWSIGYMGYPVNVYTAPVESGGYYNIEHVRMHGMTAHIEVTGMSARAVWLDLRARVRSWVNLPDQFTKPNLFHTSLVWESAPTWPSSLHTVLFMIDGVNSMTEVTWDDEVDYTLPSVFGKRVVYETGEQLGNIVMSADSPRVDRTAGLDRYATAVEISRAYNPDGNAWTDYTVVLCTGENFPDALAATPYAAQLGAPLLLTRSTSIPPVVVTELQRLKPSRIVIVGGPSAVSFDIEDELISAGYTVDRVDGADRYMTALLLLDKYVEQTALDGVVWDHGVILARGDAFPDALAAGPAAAGGHRPILLTRPTSLPDSVAWAYEGGGFEHTIIVGGTTAVSTTVQQQVDGWSVTP